MTGLKTLVNLPDFSKEKEFVYLKLEQPDGPYLKFRYSIKNNLQFYSNKYREYVPIWHTWDNEVYSDAKNYIEKLNINPEKIKDWFIKLDLLFKEELKKHENKS